MWVEGRSTGRPGMPGPRDRSMPLHTHPLSTLPLVTSLGIIVSVLLSQVNNSVSRRVCSVLLLAKHND